MKTIAQEITATLMPVYGEREAEELSYWIIEETMGLTRTEVQFGCKDTQKIPNIQIILERLLKKEPIQYIFGHTLWKGLDLKVNQDTLIPRPETAELVEWVASMPPSKLRVLDIGTGSGCIAIALKKARPEWDIMACDISQEALAIAKENAFLNNAQISFFQTDILRLPSLDSFAPDVVVSNPPYICEEERAQMSDNVLLYEPQTALFVPNNDPLKFYRRIAQLVAESTHETTLFFEINERFGNATQQMLSKQQFEQVELRKDMYGKDRMMRAVWRYKII